MKRYNIDIDNINEPRVLKKRKLCIQHIKTNHEQIQQIILQQQRIIEEFGKTINDLNIKIEKLDNIVHKQQLILREIMPPTIFNSSSPPSYIY